ncbi:MAG: DUF4177 domain-containing protein [Gemmobacter sp.]|nr:DUF4177 domain-containing protein [Gemmobacter sp.]
MQRYEYKVVPAPKRGEKVRGVKTTEDRFAHGLTLLMNDLGREGWDYIRADTLPCEERVGLTGRTTTFQHMLVFRRPLPEIAVPQPHVPVAAVSPVAKVHATAPEPAAAEPVTLPAPDPMDEAARRSVVQPVFSRPALTVSPRLSAVPESGPSPALGSARANGTHAEGPGHATK